MRFSLSTGWWDLRTTMENRYSPVLAPAYSSAAAVTSRYKGSTVPAAAVGGIVTWRWIVLLSPGARVTPAVSKFTRHRFSETACRVKLRVMLPSLTKVTGICTISPGWPVILSGYRQEKLVVIRTLVVRL